MPYVIHRDNQEKREDGCIKSISKCKRKSASKENKLKLGKEGGKYYPSGEFH